MFFFGFQSGRTSSLPLYLRSKRRKGRKGCKLKRVQGAVKGRIKN